MAKAKSRTQVKFGGDILAEQFFDPQDGPREYQTLRRQPFGLKGVLELRGEQGGEQLVVPVRLAEKNYEDLVTKLRDIKSKTGTHAELELVYQSTSKSGSDAIGMVTLDAVVTTRPRRRFVYDTAFPSGGWDILLSLVFYSLSPE